MATQIDRNPIKTQGDGVHVITALLTLITSGTTVTLTLPANTRVYSIGFVNLTTAATMVTGGTYTESTGVWVSPTMAVNDQCRVSFLVDN